MTETVKIRKNYLKVLEKDYLELLLRKYTISENLIFQELAGKDENRSQILKVLLLTDQKLLGRLKVQ